MRQLQGFVISEKKNLEHSFLHFKLFFLLFWKNQHCKTISPLNKTAMEM